MMPRGLAAKKYLSEAVQLQRAELNRMLVTTPQHLECVDLYPHTGILEDYAFRFPWKRAKHDANYEAIATVHEVPSEIAQLGENQRENQLESFENLRIFGDVEVVLSSNPKSPPPTKDDILDDLMVVRKSPCSNETFAQVNLEVWRGEEGVSEYDDYFLEEIESVPNSLNHVIPPMRDLMRKLQPKMVQDPFMDDEGRGISERNIIRDHEPKLEEFTGVTTCMTDVYSNGCSGDQDMKEVFTKEVLLRTLEEPLFENLNHSTVVNMEREPSLTGLPQLDMKPLSSDIDDISQQTKERVDLASEDIRVADFPDINSVGILGEATPTNAVTFLESPIDEPVKLEWTILGGRVEDLHRMKDSPIRPLCILSPASKERIEQDIWREEKFFTDTLTLARLPEPADSRDVLPSVVKRAKHVLSPRPDTVIAGLELALNWDPLTYSENQMKQMEKLEGISPDFTDCVGQKSFKLQFEKYGKPYLIDWHDEPLQSIVEEPLCQKHPDMEEGLSLMDDADNEKKLNGKNAKSLTGNWNGEMHKLPPQNFSHKRNSGKTILPPQNDNDVASSQLRPKNTDCDANINERLKLSAEDISSCISGKVSSFEESATRKDYIASTQPPKYIDSVVISGERVKLSAEDSSGISAKTSSFKESSARKENLTTEGPDLRDANKTDESFMGQISKLEASRKQRLEDPLESFKGDISKLEASRKQRLEDPLESFKGDISKLEASRKQKLEDPLESFKGNISKLEASQKQGLEDPLESFLMMRGAGKSLREDVGLKKVDEKCDRTPGGCDAVETSRVLAAPSTPGKDPKKPKTKNIDVVMTGEFTVVIDKIATHAEPILTFLKDKNMIPGGHQFDGLTPDVTRFMLKQHEKTMETGKECVESSETYSIVLLLHILVTAADSLLHCCLQTATACLRAMEEKYQEVLTDSLSILRQQLLQTQYKLQKERVLHPKVTALCSNVAHWLKRKKQVSTDLEPKVLVILGRDMPSLRDCLREALSEMEDLKPCSIENQPTHTQLIESLDSHTCMILSVNQIGSDFPWSQFSLVVEYKQTDGSPWKELCQRQNIRYLSLKGIKGKACSTITEPQVAEKVSKPASQTKPLTQFKFIGSEAVTTNKELLHQLEFNQNISIIERLYSMVKRPGNNRMYADIVLDERSGIILHSLQSLTELHQMEPLVQQIVTLGLKYEKCCVVLYPGCGDDKNAKTGIILHSLQSLTELHQMEPLVQQIVTLGLKYEKCCVILYPGCGDDKNTKYLFAGHVRDNLCKLYGSLSQVSPESSPYNVQVSLASNLAEVAVLIRRIGEATLEETKVWSKNDWIERSWLTEEMSEHERFLLSFPWFNSLSAQVLLSIESLPKLMSQPLPDRTKTWLPQKCLKGLDSLTQARCGITQKGAQSNASEEIGTSGEFEVSSTSHEFTAPGCGGSVKTSQDDDCVIIKTEPMDHLEIASKSPLEFIACSEPRKEFQRFNDGRPELAGVTSAISGREWEQQPVSNARGQVDADLPRGQETVFSNRPQPVTGSAIRGQANAGLGLGQETVFSNRQQPVTGNAIRGQANAGLPRGQETVYPNRRQGLSQTGDLSKGNAALEKLKVGICNDPNAKKFLPGNGQELETLFYNRQQGFSQTGNLSKGNAALEKIKRGICNDQNAKKLRPENEFETRHSDFNSGVPKRLGLPLPSKRPKLFTEFSDQVSNMGRGGTGQDRVGQLVGRRSSSSCKFGSGSGDGPCALTDRSKSDARLPGNGPSGDSIGPRALDTGTILQGKVAPKYPSQTEGIGQKYGLDQTSGRVSTKYSAATSTTGSSTEVTPLKTESVPLSEMNRKFTIGVKRPVYCANGVSIVDSLMGELQKYSAGQFMYQQNTEPDSTRSGSADMKRVPSRYPETQRLTEDADSTRSGTVDSKLQTQSAGQFLYQQNTEPDSTRSGAADMKRVPLRRYPETQRLTEEADSRPGTAESKRVPLQRYPEAQRLTEDLDSQSGTLDPKRVPLRRYPEMQRLTEDLDSRSGIADLKRVSLRRCPESQRSTEDADGTSRKPGINHNRMVIQASQLHTNPSGLKNVQIQNRNSVGVRVSQQKEREVHELLSTEDADGTSRKPGITHNQTIVRAQHLHTNPSSLKNVQIQNRNSVGVRVSQQKEKEVNELLLKRGLHGSWNSEKRNQGQDQIPTPHEILGLRSIKQEPIETDGAQPTQILNPDRQNLIQTTNSVFQPHSSQWLAERANNFLETMYQTSTRTSRSSSELNLSGFKRSNPADISQNLSTSVPSEYQDVSRGIPSPNSRVTTVFQARRTPGVAPVTPMRRPMRALTLGEDGGKKDSNEEKDRKNCGGHPLQFDSPPMDLDSESDENEGWDAGVTDLTHPNSCIPINKVVMTPQVKLQKRRLIYEKVPGAKDGQTRLSFL